MSRNKIQLFRGTSTNRKTDTASKGQSQLDDGELFLETDTNILYSKHGASDAQLQHAKPMNLSDESSLGFMKAYRIKAEPETPAVAEEYNVRIIYNYITEDGATTYSTRKTTTGGFRIRRGEPNIQIYDRENNNAPATIYTNSIRQWGTQPSYTIFSYIYTTDLATVEALRTIIFLDTIPQGLQTWLDTNAEEILIPRKISDIFEENSNAVKNATSANTVNKYVHNIHMQIFNQTLALNGFCSVIIINNSSSAITNISSLNDNLPNSSAPPLSASGGAKGAAGQQAIQIYFTGIRQGSNSNFIQLNGGYYIGGESFFSNDFNITGSMTDCVITL